MIRVSALRAHAAINGTDAAPDLLKAVQDSSPAVRSTAVQLLQGMDALDGEACRKAGQEATDTMVKIPLYGLALKFGDANTHKEATSQLNNMWKQEEGPYVRAALIDAQALDPNGNIAADVIEPMIQQAGSSIERIHAFNAVMAFYGDKTTPEVEVLIRTIAGSDDPGMLTAVAEFIASCPNYMGFNIEPLVVPLRKKLDGLQLPRDQEGSIAIHQALAHLDGSTAPPYSPPFNHPIDLARLANLKEGQRYRISTEKGEVVIAIEPNAAPGTCVAFDSLVSSGYYNGKSFNRIVPIFVAQGGCPRGDGYGAMDWTLRTEIGQTGFVAGAVGIASAGRDTESCQFFITLAPAPHLDGRYTRFAHVVSGMEVAQRLVVGDEISRVEPVQ